MNTGLRVAGAIAVGYLLGRKRRFTLALMLGTAAATGQLSRARGDLMQRATGALTDAGIGKLAKPGQQLLEAGKDAVLAALTNRADTLRGRIDDRADALGTPLDAEQKQKGAQEEEPEEPRRHKPAEGGKRGDEREEPEAREAEEDQEPEEEEEPEEPAESEEPEQEEEEEEEEESEEPEEEGEEESEEAEEEEESEEAPGEQKARRKRSDEREPRRPRSTERENRSPRARGGQKTGDRDEAKVGAPVRRSGR